MHKEPADGAAADPGLILDQIPSWALTGGCQAAGSATSARMRMTEAVLSETPRPISRPRTSSTPAGPWWTSTSY